MTWVGIVVDALATRRLVRLAIEDEITWALRIEAARRSSKLAYLLSCPACSSVWAASAVMLMPRRLRLVLALSELTIWLTVGARMIETAADRSDHP